MLAVAYEYPDTPGFATEKSATLVSDPSVQDRAFIHCTRGVFWTTDGGNNWTATPTAPPDTVFALAVHPHDPNVIYSATAAGIYRSTNQGATWTRLLSRRGMRVIKLFPGSGDTVITAGDSSGMISADAGR